MIFLFNTVCFFLYFVSCCFICFNLTCGTHTTSRDSFSESISFEQCTFPSQQENEGVLSIHNPLDHPRNVSLEVGVQFHDGDHFNDSLQNFAIEWNFNFTFTENNNRG